jgi:hypothetical protein
VAEYIASLRGLVVCEVAARLLPVQPVEELLCEKAVRAGGGVWDEGKRELAVTSGRAYLTVRL